MAIDFMEWMCNIIKSVHYANIEEMEKALIKFKNNVDTTSKGNSK